MSKNIIAIDMSDNVINAMLALKKIHNAAEVDRWKNIELHVYCDPKHTIKLEALKHKFQLSNLKIIYTPQSMLDAIQAVKSKQAQACVTCGDMNVFFTLAKAYIYPVKSVKRPILIGVLPGVNGPKLIADTSGQLYNIAENINFISILAGVYAKVILDLKSINICLLKTHTESVKNLSSVQESKSNLELVLKKYDDMNFIGVIDAKQIFNANAHVVITDGLTGMIMMSFARGFADLFIKTLKSAYKISFMHRIYSWFAKKIFSSFKQKMDTHYGSIIIGLQGVLVKVDENAQDDAIYSALLNAVRLCKSQTSINDFIERELVEIGLGAKGVWSLYDNAKKHSDK